MNIQNRVTLIGFLGKDPEVKTFDNGGKLCNVTMATDDSYKNKDGEKVSQTDWHNLVFRGALVDVVEKYLKKGSKVAVSGKIKYRTYEKDGVNHYVTEIQCDEMMMLSKNEGSAPAQSSHAAQETDETGLPF